MSAALEEAAVLLRGRPELFEADAAGLSAFLRNAPPPRPFVADAPVLGIAAGRGGESWLFRTGEGGGRERLTGDLAPLVAPRGTPPRWQSLLPLPESEPHAAMFSMPSRWRLRAIPPRAGRALMLTMPWIRNTLRRLSDFRHVEPFFFAKTQADLRADPASSVGSAALIALPLRTFWNLTAPTSCPLGTDAIVSACPFSWRTLRTRDT